ncbi:Ca++-ATPase [Acetobacter orientalis]|uniref:Ca++-ATPase n=1 Tax=Acetobacter orientalis TaxID=146474 RepID=A0A2Z5ZJR1_9PROT|nr:Ca++-ATPase [Acetobacter orientalis]
MQSHGGKAHEKQNQTQQCSLNDGPQMMIAEKGRTAKRLCSHKKRLKTAGAEAFDIKKQKK